MTDETSPMVDLDLAGMEPAALARIMVTRACGAAEAAWAEIDWDARRYNRTSELVMHLAGFCEQLLSKIGESDGLTSERVWQKIMREDR